MIYVLFVEMRMMEPTNVDAMIYRDFSEMKTIKCIYCNEWYWDGTASIHSTCPIDLDKSPYHKPT